MDMTNILSTGNQTLKTPWLNTLGDDNYILLRRGTNNGLEINFHEESGYLLSDAARQKFYETGSIEEALKYSDEIHQKWLEIFNGDIKAYAKEHSLLGTDMEVKYF